MNAPLRRGACPGLSAPMQTGDGLLVRLLPVGGIPLAAFAGLCAAARTHGNGIVEVTARGSIQIRGLTAVSAPRFAAAVGALGIAAQDGIPIHTSPLSGLDAEEIFDVTALAAELRRALAGSELTALVSPKVSVVIDGGGVLNLDALSADLRLSAELIDDRLTLRISAGGDGASAANIGTVAPENAAAAVIRLLEVIAQRGRVMRARNVFGAEGTGPFCAAIANLLIDDATSTGAPKISNVIGTHRVRNGSLACGVGLAFGHADATTLEELAEAAKAAGATGMRAAPGRSLIAIGLTQISAATFATMAEQQGFIVHADDPRRRVIACAGAPICASAYIAARAMAPSVAKTLEPIQGGARTIHISGCSKGCAHPGPAALTVVGTPEGCALVANGTARDASFAVVAAEQLTAAIASAACENSHV